MATSTTRNLRFAPLHLSLVTLATLLVAACGSDSRESTSSAQHAAASGGADQAMADLLALDPRQPVPLQPMMAWHQKQNMQEHLFAIQRIVGGLARKDWQEVADASALIESSPQMQRMCEHMGAGADGFTELALEFHRRADAIGEAARTRDAQKALEATADTLDACTSCHSQYRQDVVDAITWTQRTGQSHDPTASTSPAGHTMEHGRH